MSIRKKKINEFPVEATLAGIHVLGVKQGQNVRADLGLVEYAQMVENIPGSAVVLDVAGGHTYLCGALTSLTLRSVVDSPREAVIRFRSGAVATTISLPDTLEVVGYSVSAANMTYEINIASNRAVIVASAR